MSQSITFDVFFCGGISGKHLTYHVQTKWRLKV